MSTVSTRDLSRNPSAVLNDVTRSGRPALVTRHGRVIAALVPVDQEALEDLVLATAPQFLEDMAAASAALKAGDTVGGAELWAELSDERAG